MPSRGPGGRASARARIVCGSCARAFPLWACSAVFVGAAYLSSASAQETVYIGGSDQPSVEVNLDVLDSLGGAGSTDQRLRHPGSRGGGLAPVFLTPPGQEGTPTIHLIPPREPPTPVSKPEREKEDSFETPVVETEPEIMVAPPKPRPEPAPKHEVARVQPVEPQRAEPQRAEPQRVEPQRTEAQPVEPQRVEPQRVERKRVERKRVEAEPPKPLFAPVFKPRPEPTVARAEPLSERRALAPEPDAGTFEKAPPRLVKPEAKAVRRKTEPMEAKVGETAEPKAVDSEPVAAKPPAEEAPTRTASLTPAAVPGVAGDSLRIVFDQSEARLPQEAKGALNKIASRLTDDPLLRLQLKAYADGDAESASQARRLSLSRALAVRSELIEAGVRSTRIDVRALGNKTEDGPSDRVDVFIIKR